MGNAEPGKTPSFNSRLQGPCAGVAIDFLLLLAGFADAAPALEPDREPAHV